ncbi:polyprenyl synthetase family protein [Flavobacterium arcticum]|uniref:Polyprenyl synthetase family protein n=1 Tax=Flavobacterium arcticum TaxID=1784713 RepID=A0A345HA96_9FLAO|nr:polyprenyl synthetase family protein [Flavobacterium arcticum]AXG73506.1 polyprenyl synthetase family protein [Flavobacterium arcticum]KAF2513296.1 polyprenyl synthetase family protein [Flavobacterium arcticum]
MHAIAHYQQIIQEYFTNLSLEKEPVNLYSPIQYILSLGGKRMRPVLTLMAADVFNADCKEALPAAIAVEMFHNFSLVHDDIMDDAPLRRGNETVHEKWDVNTAILSGDAMLILAYQYFEDYEPETFRALAKLFSKTALEVCEGQQWDVDFEERNDVTIPEYLKMIEYKTAVLVGAAMKMGGIVAKTTEENCDLIYNFGLNLGIAFQLQDDYLDAFGDPETFGKQVGGDIIENKKTYLYLKALQQCDDNQKASLLQWFTSYAEDTTTKVADVKQLFQTTGADVATKEAIEAYTQKAFATLEQLDIAADKKQMLEQFGQYLMQRTV